MDKMVEVMGLTKSYGAVKAVKGIDFYVERGKLFAFLGPNGAGKSTTIDMLSTLLSPDGGEARIGGHMLGRDDNAIRQQIGVVYQDSVLDGELTVRENLKIRAKFYPADRGARQKTIDAAMRQADTLSFADRQYRKLSGGQRRRADIARALVNTPQLLFLDEPTTGLDPQTRRSIWETISGIQRERGMTVFFTTHYMEEAANADYIIIIDHGEIVARGTPLELKEKYAADTIRMKPADDEALLSLLSARGVESTRKGAQLIAPVRGKEDALALLNAVSPFISDFEVIHGTMDDVFIEVTGAEVREHA